jgi:hypothetical protein
LGIVWLQYFDERLLFFLVRGGSRRKKDELGMGSTGGRKEWVWGKTVGEGVLQMEGYWGNRVFTW